MKMMTIGSPSVETRMPESVYKAHGQIENGTFHGRWHFSFGEYHDPGNMGFGSLRVFNDDTLSPGATWPLHYHEEIEVVTYCADGEFRHADQTGKGGILKPGWVQHTTVGSGMYHSEINSLEDQPMRFIQMWFRPQEPGLKPSVEQKPVDKKERTNRLLALVANGVPGALPIAQDARVYSCFLERGHSVEHMLGDPRGAYFYVVRGGPVAVNGKSVPELGAAKIRGKMAIHAEAHDDAELLLVDVGNV